MEITHVTLGDAAERLGVPAPTLRGWCITFEETGLHVLDRNTRDERLFDDNDLEIFGYMHELKQQHGRKATTTDLCYFIASQDRFKDKLKPKIADPNPVTPKAMLTTVDVNEVIANEKFMAKLHEFVDRAIEGMEDRIVERANAAFDLAFKQAQVEVAASLEQQKAIMKDLEFTQLHKIQELIEEQRKTQELLKQQANRSIWQKIFGKKST